MTHGNNLNQMTQDQINEFKQQCQDLMPLVQIAQDQSQPKYVDRFGARSETSIVLATSS